MTDDTRGEWTAPAFDDAHVNSTEMDFERDVQRFVMEKVQSNPDSTVTCPSLTTMFLDEHIAIRPGFARNEVAAGSLLRAWRRRRR